MKLCSLEDSMNPFIEFNISMDNFIESYYSLYNRIKDNGIVGIMPEQI
jgi:hypothetical protein